MHCLNTHTQMCCFFTTALPVHSNFLHPHQNQVSSSGPGGLFPEGLSPWAVSPKSFHAGTRPAHEQPCGGCHPALARTCHVQKAGTLASFHHTSATRLLSLGRRLQDLSFQLGLAPSTPLYRGKECCLPRRARPTGIQKGG